MNDNEFEKFFNGYPMIIIIFVIIFFTLYLSTIGLENLGFFIFLVSIGGLSIIFSWLSLRRGIWVGYRFDDYSNKRIHRDKYMVKKNYILLALGMIFIIVAIIFLFFYPLI